jgi:hypothetical protein
VLLWDNESKDGGRSGAERVFPLIQDHEEQNTAVSLKQTTGQAKAAWAVARRRAVHE